MTRDLRRLLAPRTIAIIGGGAWGASIVGAARRVGFDGRIYLVHPNAKTLAGCTSARSLAAIESPIDAAFIAVNRHTTVGVVADLAASQAGGAVCFASGFSEAVAEDGSATDLQARLVEAAGVMPILGPNCYGFINALDKVAIWPDQHGMASVERGVAILTQSSNIAINLTMQRRALPIAYMITCGNQAQVSQAEIAEALLDDDRVSAIGLHIEGFGETAPWVALAQKAADRGIPLVAIKSGRSVQAQQATISHTASLAGSDAGAQALLDRLGIARVDDLPAFLETLKLLHVFGRLQNGQLSSISCSGGEASLVADSIEGRALEFPPLTDAQRRDLRAALGPMVALANPLDYHTYIWRDTEAMIAAWTPMAADHVGLTFAIVDYPYTDADDWDCATQTALSVRAASDRPFAMAATLPELMPQDVAHHLMAGGVLPACGLRELLIAAEIASRPVTLEPETPLKAPELGGPVALVDEARAKAELLDYGLDVPRSVVLQKTGDLAAACELSAPLVVKGMGLAHKSEMGAVRLGVGHAELARVVTEMPGKKVLIEEMVTGGAAELLIGVTRDPAHGFVLTLGAGGVLTELVRDTVSFLVPTTRRRLEDGLRGLKIFALLQGYRGTPAVNLHAVLDAIMAVQLYVADHADLLDELEINPLIATPDMVVAVDAVIRKG